ncbi:MAG: putative porin [Endomicrobiales bacterium]|nr:putative porin [Endomicrobiales bacterium]
MKKLSVLVLCTMCAAGAVKAEEPGKTLSWVQSMKIGGDLRFRYQNEDRSTYRRERARIRFRLQGEAMPVKDWLVAWGFATGGTDPRSTNQTLDNGFETKAFNLDYAYGSFKGVKGLNIKTGKIPVKKAIKTHGDLLWDSDIAVEGIAAGYMSDSKKLRFFGNVDYLIMDYADNGNDPSMTVVQPGVIIQINDGVKLELNAAKYILSGHKNAPAFAASANAGASNTLTGGSYLYDYNCMSLGFNLTFDNPYFDKSAFFGEYVSNPDPSEENTGLLAGIVFGAEEIKSYGQWQAKAVYRSLGKDAWMDWLSDSDARDGRTDTAGPEFVFTYGLAENVTLGVDYYISGEAKEEAGDKKCDLGQLDLTYKF